LSNGLFDEIVTRMALREIGKGDVVLDLGYELLVSDQPEVVTLQKDGLQEALIRNKDVLFIPADQVGEFKEFA
jgi:hypothetical protein